MTHSKPQDLLQSLEWRPEMMVARVGPETEESAAIAAQMKRQAGLTLVNSAGAHSCDRVLIANLWSGEIDRLENLRQAARLLRHDGHLLITQNGETGIDMAKAIHFLEHHGWTILNHREIGAKSYFLEAAVSDESVQS